MKRFSFILAFGLTTLILSACGGSAANYAGPQPSVGLTPEGNNTVSYCTKDGDRVIEKYNNITYTGRC